MLDAFDRAIRASANLVRESVPENLHRPSPRAEMAEQPIEAIQSFNDCAYGQVNSQLKDFGWRLSFSAIVLENQGSGQATET